MATQLPPPPGPKRFPCTHSRAVFGAVQIQYLDNGGVAVVWQAGECPDCAHKVVREFAARELKVA